jgi:cell division protein ZapA (FtsZ GTPase activity inhibitor)
MPLIERKIEQDQSSTIEIQVAGVPLKLRSLHDDQTVRELVGLVDEKVKQALASNSNISYQKALLLASLHIAEDLIFLKRAAVQRLDQLETKTKSLLSELSSTPLTRIEAEA